MLQKIIMHLKYFLNVLFVLLACTFCMHYQTAYPKNNPSEQLLSSTQAIPAKPAINPTLKKTQNTSCLANTAAAILANKCHPAALQTLHSAINKLDKEDFLSYLFIQKSETAKVQPIAGKSGEYIFTLYNVDPKMVIFADRPIRYAMRINTQEFIKRWTEGVNNLGLDNPNVGVVANNYDRNQKRPPNELRTLYSWVFQLSNPVYDAKQRTLTYHAKILLDSARMKLIKPGNAPTYLRDVSLNIDNVAWSSAWSRVVCCNKCLTEKTVCSRYQCCDRCLHQPENPSNPGQPAIIKTVPQAQCSSLDLDFPLF